MRIKNRYLIIVVILALILINSIALAQPTDKGDIYILPIKGNITRASHKFLEKNLNEIKKNNPAAIIFEVDTYGGLIDEAINIKDLIIDLDIPTVAYINNKAESAGVLISIASEKIVMSKTATIGSAETIPSTEKILSMWRSVLRDTAQYRERDALLVEAMADKDIVIEGIVGKNKLVNLTSKEALEYGISDLSSDNYDEIIKEFDLGSGNLVEIEESMATTISKYISNPYISSTLLTLGFAGMISEILTAGFGFGTSVSVLAFGLYFGGNIMAGYSDITTFIIFITGIMLLILELIVPGFGLPGISGIILVTVGIVLATNSLALSAISITVALVAAIIIGYIFFKLGFKNKSMKKIILDNKLDTEGNFLSTDSMYEYLDKKGVAVTELKPTGYAEINGEKVDVLSEDGYINRGEEIRVIRVEGSRIFVRRV